MISYLEKTPRKILDKVALLIFVNSSFARSVFLCSSGVVTFYYFDFLLILVYSLRNLFFFWDYLFWLINLLVKTLRHNGLRLARFCQTKFVKKMEEVTRNSVVLIGNLTYHDNWVVGKSY